MSYYKHNREIERLRALVAAYEKLVEDLQCSMLKLRELYTSARYKDQWALSEERSDTALPAPMHSPDTTILEKASAEQVTT
jgi:hypothetical protein